MKRKINILPNNVINQIAAGEVIQRPASVVKELLENSIDAQANNIQIIIQNAGKTLIQIIDDGYGMNKIDAEMCFEKHATSKIQKTEDIMKISTMGFRGEALGSIASVSQVELKTKTKSEKSGTGIIIDNSKIKKITETPTKTGTSISVKNLFFNIPARKKFLKSDQVEMKYILETFMQIAIANHQIGFKLINNGSNLYNLSPTNLKKRIIQIFGNRYKNKILPIKESTSIVNIEGFIGNPLDAKKTRGEQFIYINNRYIKSAYLNHAIKTSMENIITKDHHPSYFLFLNISSDLIDINVHPNKTEVKFEDEKSIYQILKSATKKAIGMNNIMPSLDFSTEESFEIPLHVQNRPAKEPKLNINPHFNPFKEKDDREQENLQNLENLFKDDINENPFIRDIINIDNNYAIFLLNQDKSINLMDKKGAIQRINYEKALNTFQQKQIQFTIEPIILDFNNIDIQLIKENTKLISSLGYRISEITKNHVILDAIPANMKNTNTQEVIESFLEEIKLKNDNIHDLLIQKMAQQFAYNKSAKKDNYLLNEKTTLNAIIMELLNCKTPFIGINGKPCVINIEINKIFQ